jgi:mRNA-degrading endonuclease RelE of RelBE toxin-antitoxin system
MDWTVEFLSEAIERELDSLPKEFRARFERIVQLIYTEDSIRSMSRTSSTWKVHFGKCG